MKLAKIFFLKFIILLMLLIFSKFKGFIFVFIENLVEIFREVENQVYSLLLQSLNINENYRIYIGEAGEFSVSP